ncbi:MAG: hypothetical protein MJE68_08065 [Proteobacteria bacterium]|nr:hypothetical protein [Pseudomonadota bacterium]
MYGADPLDEGDPHLGQVLYLQAYAKYLAKEFSEKSMWDIFGMVKSVMEIIEKL